MKIILKNSNLIFEKTHFERNITLEGKLTVSSNEVTEFSISGLNPNAWYKVTWPNSMWNIENYNAGYIMLNEPKRNNDTLTQTLSVPNTSENWSLPYVGNFIISGSDELKFYARADLGTDVEVTITEVQATLNKVYTYNLTASQGVGIYGLASQFTPTKNKYYTYQISDPTIISSISPSVHNANTDTYKFVMFKNSICGKVGLILDRDDLPYGKVQVGASEVIGSGNVSVDVYEISIESE